MWPCFPSGVYLAKPFILVIFYSTTCGVLRSQFVHIAVN